MNNKNNRINTGFFSICEEIAIIITLLLWPRKWNQAHMVSELREFVSAPLPFLFSELAIDFNCLYTGDWQSPWKLKKKTISIAKLYLKAQMSIRIQISISDTERGDPIWNHDTAAEPWEGFSSENLPLLQMSLFDFIFAHIPTIWNEKYKEFLTEVLIHGYGALSPLGALPVTYPMPYWRSRRFLSFPEYLFSLPPSPPLFCVCVSFLFISQTELQIDTLS